jgi:hypothetical protein
VTPSPPAISPGAIVTPIVVGLLGVKHSPAEPAGMASERDARFERRLAASAQLAEALLECGRELAESPGDADQRVAVLGQPGA